MFGLALHRSAVSSRSRRPRDHSVIALGGAGLVSVPLPAVSGYVSLEVSDNGCGFAMEGVKARGRLGLAGVVERIRLLGGDVEIQSTPGHGVLVRATVPRWRPAIQSATPVYAVTV